MTHWLLLDQSLWKKKRRAGFERVFPVAKLSIDAEGAEAERISGTQSSEHTVDLRSELGNTVGAGQSLEKMNSLPIFPDITRPVVERTAETGGGKEKS